VTSPTPNASPTLDGLFRRILSRQPQALALVDPADKMRVTTTEPQRLTLRTPTGRSRR
jgi:hypothetical protein